MQLIILTSRRAGDPFFFQNEIRKVMYKLAGVVYRPSRSVWEDLKHLELVRPLGPYVRAPWRPLVYMTST